ncbi:MAG: hypothetical protein HFI86_07810 [Bacilli bacterium]|nr:hypothetical protein [Bacilli bacterium]
MRKNFLIILSVLMLLLTILSLNLKLNDKNFFSKEKKVIISIDDTIEVFKDLTENASTYDSIFDNKLLNYFKSLHDEYGFLVTMYVFYDYGGFKLSNANDKYKDEFISNSDWLKFGFHAYNDKSNYGNSSAEQAKKEYETVINELIRICGKDSIDTNVRLHLYAGNLESVMAMKNTNFGITGLYTAEDDRQNYYFDNNLNDEISKKEILLNNDLLFIHTDYRLENINNFNQIFANNNLNNNYLTIFTHEWQFKEKLTYHQLKQVCELAINNNYSFTFIENIIDYEK